jgi:ADP-ribose pyrophosphatase
VSQQPRDEAGSTVPPGPDAWEIVARQPVYRGFYDLDVLKLRHSLFGGGWTGTLTRELYRMRRAVTVLPWDPVRDTVVLIEQFRVGAIEMQARPWLLEACAGLTEEGETAEEVARRECLEECGLAPRRLVHACDYASSPGACSERVSAYVGEVTAPDASGVFGVTDESEDIRTHVLPFDAAFALIGKGEIIAVTAVVTLLWLHANRERLRAEWQTVPA